MFILMKDNVAALPKDGTAMTKEEIPEWSKDLARYEPGWWFQNALGEEVDVEDL